MIIQLTQAGAGNVGQPIYLSTDHIAGFYPARLKHHAMGKTVETVCSLIWDESGNEDNGCFYVAETCEEILKQINQE